MNNIDDIRSTIIKGRHSANVSAARYDAEHERKRLESERLRERVQDFLVSCAAVPCPAEAYAMWLIQWISQGGAVHYSREYNLTQRRWMIPTRSTSEKIPAAYGSLALELLVLSRLADIPTIPTSGDRREGWEWGHGTVHMLNGSGGKTAAATNQPDMVESFLDVEEAILSRGHEELASRAQAKIAHALAMRFPP